MESSLKAVERELERRDAEEAEEAREAEEQERRDAGVDMTPAAAAAGGGSSALALARSSTRDATGDTAKVALSRQALNRANYPPDCPPLRVRWFHAVDVSADDSITAEPSS